MSLRHEPGPWPRGWGPIDESAAATYGDLKRRFERALRSKPSRCMITTIADCSSLSRFDIDSRTNRTVSGPTRTRCHQCGRVTKKATHLVARDKQKKTTAISVNFGAFLRHWYDRCLHLGPPMWVWRSLNDH